MNEPGPTVVDEDDVSVRQHEIAERLRRLRERMALVGGADVDVLAVSKGHPVEAAVAAARIGLGVLGENYAQDLRAKAKVLHDLGEQVEWHFIGQLQTNKVRLVATDVRVWQSVDRIKVGREIAKRAPGATVFAQVNLSSESQKAGCGFDELDELVEALHGFDLDVAGLMGVGSEGDETATAQGFRALRAAVDRLGLVHCSMGMSHDLELAIREGSTMVRVGSDLFGPCP